MKTKRILHLSLGIITDLSDEQLEKLVATQVLDIDHPDFLGQPTQPYQVTGIKSIYVTKEPRECTKRDSGN